MQQARVAQAAALLGAYTVALVGLYLGAGIAVSLTQSLGGFRGDGLEEVIEQLVVKHVLLCARGYISVNLEFVGGLRRFEVVVGVSVARLALRHRGRLLIGGATGPVGQEASPAGDQPARPRAPGY